MRRIIRNLTIAALILFAIPTAHAADLIWNGTESNNNWQTGQENWLDSNGDDTAYQIFSDDYFTDTGYETVNLVGNRVDMSIYVTGGDYTFIGSGGLRTYPKIIYFSTSFPKVMRAQLRCNMAR